METKVCTRCNIQKNINEYSLRKTSSDGLHKWCSDCCKEYNKQWRENNQEIIKNYKKKYQEENKELISKYRKKYNIDNREKRINYNNQHKEEKNEYIKKWRENNREKINKYNEDNKEVMSDYRKRYKALNKESIKEYNKLWREKNKETRSDYNKHYEVKNKASIKERKQQYNKKNNILCNVITQRYRARKRNLLSTLTAKQWGNIKKHFNNICVYCGEEKPLAQEHFVALSRGGEYTHKNIVPACKSCNSSKNNRLFNEWYPKQPFYNKDREENILRYLEMQKMT